MIESLQEDQEIEIIEPLQEKSVVNDIIDIGESVDGAEGSNIDAYDKVVVMARREAQFKMRLQGYRSTTEIYPELAKRFNCSVDSIHKDWTERERWIAEAARLADTDSILAETKGTGEAVQEHFREGVKSITRELNRYRDEDGNLDWHNDIVPLLYGFLRDFLKGTMEATTNQIKNLAKVGIIQEAPKKVQIEEKSVRINMDAFDVLKEEDRMKLFEGLFIKGADDNGSKD